MMQLARLTLIAALLAPTLAHATASLSFSGGGYWLDLEIGYRDDHPVVASISFHAPGDRRGVVLRRSLQVTRLDTTGRQLRLRYAGGDPGVEPFTLEVHGEQAVLRLGGRTIASAFDWLM